MHLRPPFALYAWLLAPDSLAAFWSMARPQQVWAIELRYVF